jgi:hypothetical protein
MYSFENAHFKWDSEQEILQRNYRIHECADIWLGTRSD